MELLQEERRKRRDERDKERVSVQDSFQTIFAGVYIFSFKYKFCFNRSSFSTERICIKSKLIFSNYSDSLIFFPEALILKRKGASHFPFSTL